MKSKYFLYSLLFILVCSIVVFAQNQKKETPPEGGKPKDFKLPAREEVKLDNGMTLVMVDYGIIPKVSVQLTLSTGRVHEQTDENRLSDLVADLMREGTTTTNSKMLATAFAKMGGDLSINTGFHQSSVDATVLSEFAPKCIELIAEVVQHPAFPASELARLKNDLKRNFNVARSSAQTQANEKFNNLFYGDHPYGRPLPSDQDIEAFTVDKVKAFYNKNFGAQRSKLYVVGKFDKAKVKDAFNKAFPQWKKGPEVAYVATKPATKAQIDLLDRPGSPQSTVMIGLPVLDPSNPDYIAFNVMNSLLGGSFGSRITSNIREDKGYTYSPYSGVQNRYRSAVWFEAADISIEHTGAALKEIVYEINRMRAEAPSEEELNGIKNYEAGNFVLQNSSAGGIISQLSFIDLHGLGDNYLNNLVKNTYAVTPEQVRKMTEKYLDPDKMMLVVVGDKKVTQAQIEAFKKADKSYKKLVD